MLSELVGKGWMLAKPATPDDDESVIGWVKEQPIKAGLELATLRDTEYETHKVYRSGQYDIFVKEDFEIARTQVCVEQSDDYE